MDQKQLKARVFISCGQERGSDEERVAQKIYGILEELGFDPYMAGLEHTQHDLMPAVLDALEKSEYFLFIDFRRDKIGDDYRGSLFSHQELAIATLLGIEQLRFKEEGVKLEGISKLLQGRPIEFSNRSHLAELVREKVVQQRWERRWKNALTIKEESHCDRPVPRTSGTADFYHIVIENLHSRKMAHDCRVYCEFLSNANETPPPHALSEYLEQKWAGVLGSQYPSD